MDYITMSNIETKDAFVGLGLEGEGVSVLFTVVVSQSGNIVISSEGHQIEMIPDAMRELFIWLSKWGYL